MRTSTAIKIRTYKGAYAGSVMARKRKIQRIKSAFISAVKLTLILLSLSAITAGTYEGYGYVVSSPYFNISDITLEGNINLKKDEVLSLCNIKTGQSIFSADIDDIYKRLKGHPWIRDAVVKKELPDKLSIKISERSPAAVLKSKGIYLMDNEGVILTELKGDAEIELPVIIEPETFAYKEGGRVNSEDVLRSIDIAERLKGAGSVFNGLPLNDKFRIEPISINRVKLYHGDGEEYIIINSDNMDKN
ncbi:MAG: FtsQ-type POTRA domain-containing protein, partial [Nitrospinae bacterium]|nr:FtsQ-type POTRA domain-containing protein [Nitrospinota bacterium]